MSLIPESFDTFVFFTQGLKARYPRGTIVCLQADPADHVFYLSKGSITLSFQKEDGTQTSFRLLKPGDLFGEVPILSEKETMGFSAFTTEPSETFFLRKDLFISEIVENKQFCQQLCTYLAKTVWSMGKHINILSLQDSYKKIIAVLASLASTTTSSSNQSHICLNITHQELAELAGLSRATVTRVLCDLEQEGLISKKSKLITITRKIFA